MGNDDRDRDDGQLSDSLAATLPAGHATALMTGPAAPPIDDTLPAVSGPAATAEARTIVSPGCYEQHEELARGGMGVVRRAHDRRVGREVALKELLADAPDLRQRFEREARITGQLQHPSIVPVYEVGHWPDGQPFYAMKLVRGRPLDAVVDEALDDDARLALIPRLLPAVEAIAYAHEQGVIHRDLKPANVLLGAFGETVVIDWGLAKLIGEEDELDQPADGAPPDLSKSARAVTAARDGGKLTVEGSVMGTPAYMPPEQAHGDELDARADVYALGALLYHTLTGRAPYDGPTAYAIVAHVLRAPPPRAAEVAPAVPPDLAGIVDKAMARDPRDRYADAGELARDLHAFSTGRLVGAYAYSSRELLLRFVRKNRGLTAALLGLVVVAVVGSSMIFRAYQVSERERARAQQAEQRALAEERAAHERLAQVHYNNAVRLLRDHDYLGAELLAAASLFEQPANAASPYAPLLGDSATQAERDAVTAGPAATWSAARALRFAARGRTLPVHDDWVYDVLTSGDGQWVVTTGADRKAHVWNARTGELHATLVGHEGSIFQASLSRDERELATSSYDGTVRLWSFPDGKPRRTFDHPSDRVYGLCHAADGTLLSAGAGGVLAFVDAASGELVERLDDVTGIPWRLSCAREAPLAVMGSSGPEAVVIDVAARRVVQRLKHTNTSVYTPVFTPDERQVITADKTGRLRRFDALSGELLAEVPTDELCEALAISADGRWLALGGNTISIVDAATFRPVSRLRDHQATVVALTFDLAGRRLFSGSLDHRVVEWTMPTTRAGQRYTAPSTSELDSAVLTADATVLVAGADDGAITLWNAETNELSGRIDAHVAPVRALRVLHADRLVSAGMDRKLKVIDLTTRETLRTIDLAHFGDELSVHPEGHTLALGRGDGAVVLYDTATWSAQTFEKIHDGRAWWLAYDPRGSLLGTAGYTGEIALLDPASGRVERRWKGHDRRIYDGAWHPDGNQLVTIDLGGWVRIWDPTNGKQLREWLVFGGERLSRVAWSRDGQRLLVTSNEGVRVFSNDGALVFRLDLGATTVAEWAPDGRMIVGVAGEVLALPLDTGAWRGDPQKLLDDAEAAAATTLAAMIGMRDTAR